MVTDRVRMSRINKVKNNVFLFLKKNSLADLFMAFPFAKINFDVLIISLGMQGVKLEMRQIWYFWV